MKISVCFAVPTEAVAFLRLLGGRSEEVRVFFTGIGMESARVRTAAHLEKERPDFLVCAGFAGALVAGLEIGEVVLGENVSSRVWDAPGCRRGRMLSTEEVVSSAEDRLTLAAKSGAMAVDMESAAVFSVAERQRVSVLTIRSISDVPGRPVPMPLEVAYDLRRQRARPVALLGWLVRHPGSIGPFIFFLKDLRTARESLATVLVRTIEHLLSEESWNAV